MNLRGRVVAACVLSGLMGACSGGHAQPPSLAFAEMPSGAVTRTTASTGLVVFNLDLTLQTGAIHVQSADVNDIVNADVAFVEFTYWHGDGGPPGIVEQWPYEGFDVVDPDADGERVLEQRSSRLLVSVGIRVPDPAANGFVANVQIDYSDDSDDSTFVVPYLFGVCRAGATEPPCPEPPTG